MAFFGLPNPTNLGRDTAVKSYLESWATTRVPVQFVGRAAVGPLTVQPTTGKQGELWPRGNKPTPG